MELTNLFWSWGENLQACLCPSQRNCWNCANLEIQTRVRPRLGLLWKHFPGETRIPTRAPACPGWIQRCLVGLGQETEDQSLHISLQEKLNRIHLDFLKNLKLTNKHLYYKHFLLWWRHVISIYCKKNTSLNQKITRLKHKEYVPGILCRKFDLFFWFHLALK